MAQIVDYYSATAGGSSAMYYYQYADNTSTATRIYTGTPIQLPKKVLKLPSTRTNSYHNIECVLDGNSFMLFFRQFVIV